MAYNKSDMYYNNYSWTAINGDDPRVSGEPDSTLLNRSEGYEMLYFVNKFIEKHPYMPGGNPNRAGRVIEFIIKNRISTDIRSQKNIEDFIVEYWNSLYPEAALFTLA